MLLFLSLLHSALAVNVEKALASPQSLLSQFNSYNLQFNKEYTTGSELRSRLMIFRSNLQFIRQQNKARLSFQSGTNVFTDMTDEELKLYHGLNTSLITEGVEGDSPLLQLSDTPDTVDWVSAGYVTSAKDQGKCGSCWAFGSVVALEGAYKKSTGTLKDFAEQEYLDCVHNDREHSGCWGGAPHKCFDYSKTTGHMASQSNYPYTAQDLSRDECDLTKFKNSLISAKVTSRYHNRYEQTEENTIKILAQGPTTLYIEATRTLHSYESGIMMDRTCWSETNHAVAGVGYTPKYIIVKNSWGSAWGESGFVKFLRGYRNCGLYNAKQYPILSLTGEEETESGVKGAEYDHSAIIGPDPPRPDPDCENGFGDAFCNRISLTNCHAPQYRDSFCRKKCGNCWIE